MAKTSRKRQLPPPEFNVVEWLGKHYADYPCRVDLITMKTVPSPSLRANKKQELFKAAFYGRDSVQHGWLKWFAMNHLHCLARYEVERFIPDTLGKWGNGAGKILPKGHQWFLASGWRSQRADLCDSETLVEVGVTSPQSLVEPLWSYAVKKVIWVPFQSENTSDEWKDFANPVKAYRIQRNATKRK